MRDIIWGKESFFLTGLPLKTTRLVSVYEGNTETVYYGDYGDSLAEIDLATGLTSDNVPDDVLDDIRQNNQSIRRFAAGDIDYEELCVTIRPEKYYLRRNGRLGFRLKEDRERLRKNRKKLRQKEKESKKQEKKIPYPTREEYYKEQRVCPECEASGIPTILPVELDEEYVTYRCYACGCIWTSPVYVEKRKKREQRRRNKSK